jgi:hypothetical protein
MEGWVTTVTRSGLGTWHGRGSRANLSWLKLCRPDGYVAGPSSHWPRVSGGKELTRTGTGAHPGSLVVAASRLIPDSGTGAAAKSVHMSLWRTDLCHRVGRLGIICVCVANKIYLGALTEALSCSIAEVDCPEALPEVVYSVRPVTVE